MAAVGHGAALARDQRLVDETGNPAAHIPHQQRATRSARLSTLFCPGGRWRMLRGSTPQRTTAPRRLDERQTR
eukprot:scaffold5233_cov127-Isochrysis_galbana.AAC.2